MQHMRQMGVWATVQPKGDTTNTIDDGALPYYEYSERTDTAATEDRDHLYLESDYSDDDGHRECRL